MKKFNYLEKHKYFKRKEIDKWDFGYYFQENGVEYQLYIPCEFDEDGIKWSSMGGEGDELIVQPLWFRLLFKETTEQYFEMNRVKMIVDQQKRKIGNIALCSTIGEKEEKILFNSYNLDYETMMRINVKDKQIASSLYELMKKYEASLQLRYNEEIKKYQILRMI